MMRSQSQGSTGPLRRCAAGLAATFVACAMVTLCAPAAFAGGGRLIETGHDADWHCAVTGANCHFIAVAVNYVRNGAPDPSKPILVLDTADLQMKKAISDAIPGIAGSLVVMAPRSPEFRAANLSTDVYSAIVVASDETCGDDASGQTFFHGNPNTPAAYCDLNRPPNGLNIDLSPWPPPTPALPAEDLRDPSVSDSAAIVQRASDIKAFFDSGGGLFAGAGADNGDGHQGDFYYGFIDLPSCPPGSALCEGTSGGFSLTRDGKAVGFTDGTNGPDDITCGSGGQACATHNQFLVPRLGSQLLVAENGNTPGLVNTLFADGTAPNTSIDAGPATPLSVTGVLPVVATSSATADFAFHASEDTTTSVCSLDGASASPCSASASYAGLAEGVHRFDVTATDAAGNTDPTPAEFSWLVASDKDGDGYLDINPYAAGSVDCNDGQAAVHPAAKEVLGNRIDENCDGNLAPWFSAPAANLQYAFNRCGRRCLRYTRLSLVNVPAGSKVRFQCTGPRCHFVRRLNQTSASPKRTNLLKLLGTRSLPLGSVLRVTVTKADTISAIRVLTVVNKKRRAEARLRLLCQAPDAKRAGETCSGIS